MMRELDTVSPVVWPAWCYSGEGQGDVESTGANTELHQQASAAVATAAVATPKPRGKRRGAPASATAAMNGGGDHHNNNNNNNNIPVKTERLSPSTTSATASANTPDNSSSSRSATPSSSYPGTPPGVPAERGASPAPSPAGHLKHMEQMMTRNYSDFMRSLAAKYNNANPNDYFSTPARNGYPVTLDPRFSSFKAGNTPFVGLMAPLATTTMSSPIHKNNNSIPSANNSTSSGATTSTTASTKDSCPDGNHMKKEAMASSVEAQQALYAAAASSFAPNPFATRAATNPGMFPPMIDMSSTHALLNMVRTANAHNASQLETYLKGAIKRPAPSESTPLDLSSASLPTYTKKSRTNKSMSASDNMFIKSESLLNIPMMDVLRTTKKRLGSVSPKLPSRGVGNSGGSSAGSSPRLGAAATVTSQHVYGRSLPCMSVCTNSERPCSGSADSQTVAHWTVDDVCSFVASIDNCAEYSQHFREQLIDGSSLPLLTEEHLTSTMSMKLGPALKLRATLARRLGHCAVCLHCVHCHSAATLPAPVSPAQTPPASALARPNSTGVYQERAVAPHGILTVASPN